ncbi:MAG: hypothetical protein ABWJ42_00310 [Sulfolobales archaeon]
MIWFSYVVGPNGPSIRIYYTAPVDIDSRENLERYIDLFASKEGVNVSILCVDSERDLYYIARVDPDLVDVLKEKKYCVAIISAGSKAMGSR